MELSGIISIGGMSGLYKVVAQSKGGFVVESLIDKKRTQAFSSYKISSLDDITVYGNAGDISLKDVFTKMRDMLNSAAALDHKSADDELKKFFGESFTDYDKERVHISDIRKIISWYNMLQKNDLLKDKAVSDGEETVDPIKAALEEKQKNIHKAVAKDHGAKAVKTNAPKKTQGVRKTGVA